jgi:hypothetical protein
MDFAVEDRVFERSRGILNMANWWKCRVVRPSMMIPFSKGEFIFAKNGDESITLFNGQEGLKAPKAVLRYLLLMSRLQNPDSEQIQQDYERKRGD